MTTAEGDHISYPEDDGSASGVRDLKLDAST